MENPLVRPRLIPKNPEEMRPEWVETLKRIPGDSLKGKYAPVNVLGTLMYNPETLGPFLDYWVTSKLKMGFSVREQELIILRMGVHYRCDYVWMHHIPVALEFGVTEKELDALKVNPLPSIFSARDEALLVLTDQLVDQRNISDEMWNKYRPQLKDSEVVDLISIVSQYVLFALTNNVMRVEVEHSLVEGLPSKYHLNAR